MSCFLLLYNMNCLAPIIKMQFTLIGIALHRHLIVQLHHRIAQVLHNTQHLHLPILLALHRVPAITNIHPRRPLLLLVQHTLQPVQCIHHRMRHTLHLLCNIHQILELHSTTSLTVRVHQFTHLLTSH